MTKKKPKTTVQDEVVIYHSNEDGCWISHSLRTDQIGTGTRIVDALADMIRAVHQVSELHKHDKTVRVFREAPQDIKAIAKRAKRLPGEIYELAHKMVHGEWPQDVDFDITPSDQDESLTVHVPPQSAC